MATMKSTINAYNLEKENVFYATPDIFDPITFLAKRKISFEIIGYPDMNVFTEDLAETIAEKLKQDYKNALLNNTFKEDPSFKSFEEKK